MKANSVNARNFLLSIFAGTVTLAVTFPFSSLPAVAQTIAASAAADEQAIRKQADDFSKAFAAADANGIANMWTDDCSFTDVDGQRYLGRDAVHKLYEQFFHENGPQATVVKIESLTFPSADVCLEEGLTTLVKTGRSNRYTVVHVKRHGEWKMLSVVESRCDSSSSQSLKDLSWLIGDWMAKTTSGVIHLKVQSISNGNFIAARYLDVDGTKETPKELQLIGLDPQTKHIISWHFGGNGGYGLGRWRHDGSTWNNRTTGVTADGIATSATYLYKQVDGDNFTWSSTDRIIAGRKLQDREPVQVTRTKTAAPGTEAVD